MPSPVIDPLYLLIFGLVGVIGCGLVAFFGWRVYQDERSQKDKEARKEAIAAQAAESLAPAAPAAPKAGGLGDVFGAFTARASAPSAPGAHEVLRVLRDHLTGRLLVEIGGKRYHHLGEIQDAALREGLLISVRDLQMFVDGAHTVASTPTPSVAPTTPTSDWLSARMPQAAVPAAQPSETPRTASHPTPAARLAPDRAEAYRAEIARPEAPKPVTPPATSTSTASQAPGSLTPATKPGAIPLPSMNPFKQMEVLREMAKNPPPTPKSIPEEIDEVLQEKVSVSPYAQRGVKVATSPKGTVRFELDGQSYEAVDELPDANVRALVKAAIAEWEKKK